MLEVKNLNVNYGERDILKNVSFSLNKGETISIIGPSGCGKSTLLLAIARLKEVTSGDILNSFSDTGLILQNHGLFPWKTIRDNLALGLLSRQYKKDTIQTKIDAIASSFKINHLLDKFPAELSGGERQRAAVARVLVFNPEILLLDEPSSALDSLNKSNFQDLLCNIQKNFNMSYILVTHDIEEAVLLGQKILVMIDGEVKSILSNDCYGKRDIRSSYEFFDKCNEVRNLLNEFGGLKNE